MFYIKEPVPITVPVWSPDFETPCIYEIYENGLLLYKII